MAASSVHIPPSRSVSAFSLLAVLMVIVSYILLLVIAAACVYLPYLALTRLNTMNAQMFVLLFGGVLVAGALLWSMAPRRDHFKAPGLLLDRSSQPTLFKEIDAIAAALNEQVPAEVYPVGQPNAFVADRGGILGFGSRRVMGIGLPLLSVLSVTELRAVPCSLTNLRTSTVETLLWDLGFIALRVPYCAFFGTWMSLTFSPA